MPLPESFVVRWIIVASVGWVLYQLYHLVSEAWKSRSYDKPPSISTPWWDVFGITIVAGILKSFNEDRMLEWMQIQRSESEAIHGRRIFTFRMNLLGRTAYSTTDPKNIQAILALQFTDYGLGANRIGSFLPMLGTGVFASDGKAWEHSRAMLRPSFARDRIENVSLEEKHSQHLFNALPEHGADGWTPEFDIQPFFFKLTMDSATEFFFGESSYSLSAEKGSPEARFVEAFDRGQCIVGQRASIGPIYWLKTSRSFRADCKIVHEWTDQCVQRALSKHRSKEERSSGKDQYIFLDELIDQTKDLVELRSQLLNVLIAGRDTTASLLSWVFFHLSRRPEEYDKLRRVILDTFGTFEKPQDMTFASLKSCKPLQNFLKETLRLHPSVPTNIRQALKDTTLPRGGGPNGDQSCFVPKNAQVYYSVYAMHRDPSIWGPDAAEFIPDRWNNIRVGWEYLPFNGGPRICLGQIFSLTSAGYCVVRMLQKFDRIHTSDLRPAKTHISLTAYNSNGVNVRLHEAT